jgi:hypothetical protein
MDRFNALGRGTQLMAVSALLLFIDLFLPWQDFNLGGLADEFGVDASFSGWRGFAGVVLGLLTVILLAWVIVRLASVNIPLPVSTAMTAAMLGVLILIFAVIKLLTILGDEQTIWAWIGLILAILVAVGAFRTVQEAGGVDTLKSEASSLSSGGTASSGGAASSSGAATETAHDAASGAKDAASDAAGAVESGAESAADKATDTASDVADAAQDKID